MRFLVCVLTLFVWASAAMAEYDEACVIKIEPAERGGPPRGSPVQDVTEGESDLCAQAAEAVNSVEVRTLNTVVKEQAMREIHRVLRPGGAALVGGRYLYMPASRKVSSETLRRSAARTGIRYIRVYDDMGQWVEIRKGIRDRGYRD